MAVRSTQITSGIPGQPAQFGQFFFDQTFPVLFQATEGPVMISGNNDGTGSIHVDDEVYIDITRPDSTVSSYYKDHSYGCGNFQIESPENLTSRFQVGTN